MSAAKHTPGPWIFVGSVGDVSGDDLWSGAVSTDEQTTWRGNICRIQSCEHIDGIPAEEAEANAKLIASAPTLAMRASIADDMNDLIIEAMEKMTCECDEDETTRHHCLMHRMERVVEEYHQASAATPRPAATRQCSADVVSTQAASLPKTVLALQDVADFAASEIPTLSWRCEPIASDTPGLCYYLIGNDGLNESKRVLFVEHDGECEVRRSARSIHNALIVRGTLTVVGVAS